MKFLIGTAVAALIAGTAHAAPITIDDFNTLQVVTDDTDNGASVSSSENYTIDGNAFTRTITVDQIQHSSADPALSSTANVGFGSLKLSNASQTNAMISASYDIDSLTDDVFGSSELTLDVIFTDASVGEMFTIAGFLNDEFIGSESFTGPGAFSLALPDLLASGNTLRLEFSGGTAFDAELGPVVLQVNGEIPVPEPGALGLLGLGLAALAGARRRKAA